MIDVRYRTIWQNAVLACPDLSATVCRVAMAISQCLYPGNDCFPSYELLGKNAAVSRDTAMRAVKGLEAAGWLGVMRTKGRRSNTFMLLMPASLAIPEAPALMTGNDAVRPLAVSQQSQAGATVALSEQSQAGATVAKMEQSQIAAPTVAQLCNPKNSKNISPLNPPTQPGSDIDAAFEVLWTIWSNDADKGKARSAFHRATSASGLGVSPEAIIAAARERRLRRLTANASEAVPLARWLRGEGWSGEAKPASAHERKPAQAAKPQVFVEEGSPAWTAWRTYRQRQGKSTPSSTFASQSGRRGWHFESEWPPGSVASGSFLSAPVREQSCPGFSYS